MNDSKSCVLAVKWIYFFYSKSRNRVLHNKTLEENNTKQDRDRRKFSSSVKRLLTMSFWIPIMKKKFSIVYWIKSMRVAEEYALNIFLNLWRQFFSKYWEFLLKKFEFFVNIFSSLILNLFFTVAKMQKTSSNVVIVSKTCDDCFCEVYLVVE